MSKGLILCTALHLLVLSGVFNNSHGARIPCETVTHFFGQPAAITCDFRTNISASQRTYHMTRYPFDAKNGDIGTDVLVCHWDRESQKPYCNVMDGYTLNGVNDSHVTVGIPEVTEEYAGLYMCFCVPSQVKEILACLHFNTVADKPTNGRQLGAPLGVDDKPNTIVKAVVSVVPAVLSIVCVVMCICGIRRRKKKTNDHNVYVKLEETGGTYPRNRPKKEQIRNKLEQLRNRDPRISITVDREINTRSESVKLYPVSFPLHGTSGEPPSSWTFSPVGVAMMNKRCSVFTKTTSPSVSSNESKGDFLVVDISYDCVKVSDVQLRKPGMNVSDRYPVPLRYKNGTSKQFVAFIIGCMDTFLCDHIPDAKTRNAVFIIPFPCDQPSLQQATIIEGTHTFTCNTVGGRDLHALLRKALESKKLGKKPCKVNFVAIVDAAVCTLMTAAHENKKCKIGLVVDNGFNACFVEKTGPDGAKEKIYNVQVWALGGNGLENVRSDFDRELDELLGASNKQILERMVSWSHIVDIVRIALGQLKEDELLLPQLSKGCALFQKGGLTGDDIAQIDSDVEAPYTDTAHILMKLDVDMCTQEDLQTVHSVCRLVFDRAAYMVAAVLAALINRLDQPGVVIVVGGKLNKKLPRFNDVLYRTTNELVKSELKHKFSLVPCFGYDIVAARIAEASLRWKHR